MLSLKFNTLGWETSNTKHQSLPLILLELGCLRGGAHSWPADLCLERKNWFMVKLGFSNKIEGWDFSFRALFKIWYGFALNMFNVLILVYSRYFANLSVRDEHFKTKRHKKRLVTLPSSFFMSFCFSYLNFHLINWWMFWCSIE